MRDFLTVANIMLGANMGWFWRDMRWWHRVLGVVAMVLIACIQVTYFPAKP